jgi:hypothetical protein
MLTKSDYIYSSSDRFYQIHIQFLNTVRHDVRWVRDVNYIQILFKTMLNG